jgi:hypothetical protein
MTNHPSPNPHDDDAAYEAHIAAEYERMCPDVRSMSDGFDDPMTHAYGASDVVADSIARHVARCAHPWCVEQRGELTFDEAEAAGLDGTQRSLSVNSSPYAIVCRTDLDDVSVITIAETSSDGGVWTLVSHADGSDVLVTPRGLHVERVELADVPSFRALLDWLVANV